ncbi:MAG: ATP-binding protein [Candidatus Electrothrix sp. YB6]
MSTLGEQWVTRRDGYRSKTGWALQVVQDTLAMQVTMPLRLYDVNAAKSIEGYFDELEYDLQGKREYSNQETGDLLCSIEATGLTRKFSSYYYSPWATRSSNNDMLIEKISSWNVWQCFQYVIMKEIHKNYLDNLDNITLTVCEKLIYYFYRIRTDKSDMDFILVGGPRIDIPCNEGTCSIEETVDFFQKFGTVLIDSQAPQWTRPDRTDLTILCRAVNTPDEVREQLQQTGKSVKRLFDIDISPEIHEDIIFNRKTVMKIARHAFDRASSHRDTSVNTFYIPINQRKDNTIQLHIDNSKRQWKIIRAINRPSEADSSFIEESAETILFEQNRIFYFHQRLKLLRSWIEHHVGIIAAEHTAETGDSIDPIVNKLAAQIADLLLAETASIFRYDYHTESLCALALYYSGGDRMQGAAEWKESQMHLIREAAKDKEKRKSSISYRVKDGKKKDRLCYFYDHKTGIADPLEETLLSAASDTYERPKSGMALPIYIHGRLFGVLEVSGLCEYQFGQDDLYYASLIADEIGRNLYQKYVWQYINYVIKETNIHADSQQKYNALCEAACKIFMAETSTFWKPDNSRKACHPIGWFNREDLNEICEDENCESRLEEDYGSSIGTAIKKLLGNPDEYYACSDIQTLKENDPEGWNANTINEMKPQRRWILENEITSVVVIPLYPWEKREERGESFQFILCLYYKDSERKDPLGSQWNPTVKFVAHNFGLHLETIKLEKDKDTLEAETIKLANDKDTLEAAKASREKEIKGMEQKINELGTTIDEKNRLQKKKGLIEHELKGQIPLVLEKAGNILDSIRKTPRGRLIIDRQKAFRLEEWMQDLEIYKQDLHLMLLLLNDDKLADETPDIGRLTFNISELRGKKITKKRVKVREVFNSLYRGTNYDRCRKNIQDDTALSGEIWPAVLIAEEHLTRILSNLISNAVKYSLPHTSISVKGEFDRFQNFTLSISNYTAPFSEEFDISRLKLYGVRGSNNIENISGKGLGLYLVDGLCSYNSLGLDFDYQESEYDGILCGKFTANLLFPCDSILIKTPEEKTI